MGFFLKNQKTTWMSFSSMPQDVRGFLIREIESSIRFEKIQLDFKKFDSIWKFLFLFVKNQIRLCYK